MKDIKCVVWDLDNTVWNGVLLEDKEVRIKENVLEVMQELDSRGILQSIASRNNYDHAMGKLKELGIDKYFLYPEIHWEDKSESIKNIQQNINIGIDTFMFVDDQQYELDEVNSVHHDVMCVNACEVDKILDHPRLNPRFITEDSKRRRLMYQEDIERNKAEETHGGSKEAFLDSLGLEFTISEAAEEDLRRAEELTVRTNQLNSTGVTYDYDELNSYRQSDNHKLYICELSDRYGSYGKIGLALVELKENHWHLKLLLMSCRVISRGVGTVLMSYIMNQAKESGKGFKADFKKTDKNKAMYVSYKFANFKETFSDEETGQILFENDLSFIHPYPHYIKLITKGE